jgi:hypothetical protein
MRSETSDSEAEFFGRPTPAMQIGRGRLRSEPAQTLGDVRMNFAGAFVSKLSVVAAYVAFAFVGAIVLGVF